MYFDVKPSNLKEVLKEWPIHNDVGATVLQKVQKHIP